MEKGRAELLCFMSPQDLNDIGNIVLSVPSFEFGWNKDVVTFYLTLDDARRSSC